MTTRTITVNTPEQTEVAICDECGLGDGKGDLVEFAPYESDLDTELHYHRDCAREQTGNPQTLSDAYHDAVGAEMEYQISLVLTLFGLRWLLFSLGLFLYGALATVLAGVSFLPAAIWAFGAVGIGFILFVGHDNGKKTAEELV